jgi:RpiB/LacA/LacB family sugar-phosphate isomerase|tara:strand:- start:12883 stop:14040 length:1158 start_codon:yes stop_codon:yes gene_type:complete
MKKYNLLLPIAGKAQRFINEGYTMPKPLIMSREKHIIDWSMESIDTSECNIIFAVRLDHINNFSIDKILKQKFGNDIEIVVIDKVTDGSVSTCLLAKEQINNDLPLIIYTPDVYFENQFVPKDIPTDLDGFVLTFKANSAAHSYVELGDDNLALRTAEKEVISENAAVGVYYYKTGKMFVDYAEHMIRENIRTKNEFYICPMYNLMIEDNLKVGISQVEKMHVLGTPAELEFFVNHGSVRFGEKPVAICCDHSGFELKEQAKSILESNNIAYVDFGTYTGRSCDYNEYVAQAAKAMQTNLCDFGIGFCRTGQGVNILANHLEGLRSALVFDEYTAEYSIKHNCVNFFAVPQKYVTPELFEKMVKKWKTTSFDGGRHMTRMAKTIG